jgi:hypothetical protein
MVVPHSDEITKQWTNERKQEELRWMKIYDLAEKAVNEEQIRESEIKSEAQSRTWLWRKSVEPDFLALPSPLKWLAKNVVAGDTWGTFVAFEASLKNQGVWP